VVLVFFLLCAYFLYHYEVKKMQLLDFFTLYFFFCFSWDFTSLNNNPLSCKHGRATFIPYQESGLHSVEKSPGYLQLKKINGRDSTPIPNEDHAQPD